MLDNMVLTSLLQYLKFWIYDDILSKIVLYAILFGMMFIKKYQKEVR